MRVVQLTAENLKRLVAVDITPGDENVVVIAGKNGQGKTSVLDAIWFALGGGRAQSDTARPIRDGADTAMVSLDLGDLRVTRTWTASGSQLKVESADGARYQKPQAMLDALIGRLSFDPLAFSQQDEKTQLADLLALVDLPFDPAEVDGKRRRLFEERTEVGRQGKQLAGQLAGFPPQADGTPTEEVSLSDLVAEHRAALAAHAEHREWFEEAEGIGRNVEGYSAEVDRLESALSAARQTLAEHRSDLVNAQANRDRYAAALPDLSAIEARITTVEETNRAVRAGRERAAVATAVGNTRAQYEQLTEQINAVDEQKRAGLAEAKFPVDGLGFDEDGVTYLGIPFKQCSAAERLRVSLGMAMALNPKLRVIRITDGSLLDSDNMRLIEEMATENDFQVWVERVDETGQVGIVIDDGQVAS